MPVEIRKAIVKDAEEIRKVINAYASENRMLPRSLSEIYENIRDYSVGEDGGEVVGSCALHIFWNDLAELRSLAVRSDHLGRQVGIRMIRRVLSEAPALGIRKVFILTAIPRYFEKVGFRAVEKSELPQKIWAECIRCPKFPDCDEVAMIVETEEGS
jgi:amino-acid N-acetyltransferase